jgi:hypothetical protein
MQNLEKEKEKRAKTVLSVFVAVDRPEVLYKYLIYDSTGSLTSVCC